MEPLVVEIGTTYSDIAGVVAAVVGGICAVWAARLQVRVVKQASENPAVASSGSAANSGRPGRARLGVHSIPMLGVVPFLLGGFLCLGFWKGEVNRINELVPQLAGHVDELQRGLEIYRAANAAGSGVSEERVDVLWAEVLLDRAHQWRVAESVIASDGRRNLYSLGVLLFLGHVCLILANVSRRLLTG